jgi:hypothetical protein
MFFPGEWIPDQHTVNSIRHMRKQGKWSLADIAHYNFVSVGAVRVLSEDCAAEVDESQIKSVLSSGQLARSPG